MYTYATTNRCSLCYALLSTSTATSSSTIGCSSNNRRHASRCSTSTIERLVLSSPRFERLWRRNENGIVNNRSICFRCCETIRQLEQIKIDVQRLNNERQILMNKIEHNLYKRALIVQGQRQRISPQMTSILSHQQMPFNDDEDTEEGEAKSPRIVITTNGHEHSPPIVRPPTTLVGAKRRKCKVAHKISVEDKFVESSPSLLNHIRRSSSPLSRAINTPIKFSPSLIFGALSPKHRRPPVFPPVINGHNNDLASLAFGAAAAYKPLALQTAFGNSQSPSASPFLDPSTGALIAIVSNPHHAALLASHHQQHPMLKPPSVSPSSIHTIDDHDNTPKQPLHPKKFPCQLCGRDFSNKSNLNRHHSIVHVAIRNFECARCPKKFKLRQGLKTHMQRCHGVNTDEPTFVLQKHHTPPPHHHHHHHHLHNHHLSPPSFVAQSNK